MDDKILEQKLESLKKSYNELPLLSDTEAITSAVRKSSKKRYRPVPLVAYAASLIGVAIISVILALFLMESSKEKNSRQPSGTPPKQEEEQPKTAPAYEIQSFEELEEYYLKKEQETENLTGIANFSETELAIGVQAEIGTAKQENLSGEPLLQKFASLKEEIDLLLTAPVQFKPELTSVGSEKEQESKFERYNEQQQRFLPVYQEKLVPISELVYRENISQDFFQMLEKLNEGSGITSNQELNMYLEGLKKNGYYFVDSGEGMLNIKIDYESIYKEASTGASAYIKDYLDIKKSQPEIKDGALLSSWQDLGRHLAQTEEIIIDMREGKLTDALKQDYRRYFGFFLKGIDNTRVLGDDGIVKSDVRDAWQAVIMEYPETETATALEQYYQALEEKGFRAEDDFDYTNLPYPSFVIEK
ncbi:hypothetical protein D0469_08295 [Peribacillus saganii]|uniref:Uncharacterized protein n=1 Tax=Peribacillus saganii TaxID=2303992 RepID=A0A372LPW9_9BACI|nr:hypothetical protein [Peribacillus saganii]RFU70172.1 hypothetical protein D0469_08295 [Peribacillus saganii]